MTKTLPTAVPLAQIVIPAGTVLEVAGMPLRLGTDATAEGSPTELADLHALLYPAGSHSDARPAHQLDACTDLGELQRLRYELDGVLVDIDQGKALYRFNATSVATLQRVKHRLSELAQGAELPVGPCNGLARVEGDSIVVRLTADACAFAFAHDPRASEPRPPVTDAPRFLRETFNALTAEREDGSTLLTDALDRAMVRAWQHGAEGLDHDTSAAS